jgi:hypothetical protein
MLAIQITHVAAAISVRPCRYWRSAEYTRKHGTVVSFSRL